MIGLLKRHLIKQATVLLGCSLLTLVCLAQPRSKEDIGTIVQQFHANHGISSSSEFVCKMQSSQLCPTKLSEGKEAFYLYADTDGRGFAIVSGDKRMPRILGYSTSNRFDANNIPPNVAYWLNCYIEAYSNLPEKDENMAQTPLTSHVRDEGVAPLLGELAWGQEEPYNLQCPLYRKQKCVTGCVATAMAQVMKYYSYPESPKGKIEYQTETHKLHVTKDLSEDTFLWNKMRDRYDNGYTEEEAGAVATLMYDCGVAVNMDYSPDGSGSYQQDLLKAYVENFSYDRDAALLVRDYCTTEEWHNLLIRELNEGRPVNYAGSNSTDGGHSFVLDGYRVSENNTYPDYHVNWGWDGECDGYYQIASLHPREGNSFGSREGFIEGQQMTIGVKPDDGVSDGQIYLCTDNLRVSPKRTKPGEKVRVYSALCYNLSYNQFMGEIAAVLVSEDGSETIVGNTHISGWNTLEGQNNFVLDVVVPTNVEDGDYTVQLRCRQNNSDTWNTVCSKSHASLIVLNSESGEEDVYETESSLACSEAELTNSDDGKTIALNLYEVGSLQEDVFVGTLRMILASRYGQVIQAFGDSATAGELEQWTTLPEHIHLEGCLTGTLEDGRYRLYVGVKSITEERYTYLQHFDWAMTMADPSELYFEVEIKNGVAQIQNNSYIVVPTGIEQPTKEKCAEGNGTPYTLTGMPVTKEVVHSRPGIYILNNRKIIIH